MYMTSVSIFPGVVRETYAHQCSAFSAQSRIQRIWDADHTVWRSEEIHQRSILNRLGWLKSISLMTANAATLNGFAEEIRAAGFTHVVVLGMGGSSLCPDVCRSVFGSAPGYPALLVLDSTDPASVLRIERSVVLKTTLFIVASKSGGTTETNMFYKYFYDRIAAVKPNPGENFVAITDADTAMESIARERQFRKIFVNPTDIGGRYSALSYFGLVPMALIGMDIAKLLHSAETMKAQCLFDVVQNPAAQTGLLMGEAHNEGIDKLTFIMSGAIAPFGYWAEQLIAESTGKEGKGILPIEGESHTENYGDRSYGTDRMFVFLLLEEETHRYDGFRDELTKRDVPFVTVLLKDPYDLGAQFFFWEFATAVSAVVLNINPFDEPNVKESKDNTVRVIEEYKKNGALPRNTVLASDATVTVYGEPDAAQLYSGRSVAESVKKFCAGKAGEDYIAVLAYVDQNPANEKQLRSLREQLSARSGLPVTVGFGPRYLHSTGQLHKGGKPNGIFLLITADDTKDVTIPGEQFSFGVLKNAQSLGDYRSFADRRLRLLHFHLRGPAEAGLRAFSTYFS